MFKLRNVIGCFPSPKSINPVCIYRGISSSLRVQASSDDLHELEKISDVHPIGKDQTSHSSNSTEKTINSVTLLGRIGTNPVQRGSIEHPVVTFPLATNSNYKYSNGEIAQKTEWHRICIFKPHLRESVFKYAEKGQRVLVEGRIIYGEIKDTDGNARATTSIVADEVIYFRNG